MGIWADRMVERFEAQVAWPSADDKRVWDQVRTWIAFRETDRDVLRANARWRNQIRQYRADPVAPLISEAFASAIFGRRPSFTPAVESDGGNLANLVKANKFARRLQREAQRVSSEAETWYRIVSRPDEDEAPMVEFRSRLDVIPSFSRDLLRAVAFIDDLDSPLGGGQQERWRHFEIIDDEHILNVLFLGTHDTIGGQLDLSAHPETRDLAESVLHELPRMPAGRVINKEGVDPFYGLSDYARIEDDLYGLDELLTIFMENARLTLKKRAVVPASAVDEAGTIDASQEILVNEALHEDLGKGGQGSGASQFQVLEYKSDIQDVIAAQNATAERALTRIGITPAFVGLTTDQSEGRAVTGTALRLRLIPTDNASADRAQWWDDELPAMLTNLQILDARPPSEPGVTGEGGEAVLGGFGRAWSAPEQPPGVNRGPTLPQDPVEESEIHATRVSASIESRYTAIRELHPDWDDGMIDQEIARIKQDLADTPGSQALGGLFGTGRLPSKVKGVE